MYIYTYIHNDTNVFTFNHVAGLSKDASRQAKKSKLLVSRGLPRLLALVCERASESGCSCGCVCVRVWWVCERRSARACLYR